MLNPFLKVLICLFEQPILTPNASNTAAWSGSLGIRFFLSVFQRAGCSNRLLSVKEDGVIRWVKCCLLHICIFINVNLTAEPWQSCHIWWAGSENVLVGAVEKQDWMMFCTLSTVSLCKSWRWLINMFLRSWVWFIFYTHFILFQGCRQGAGADQGMHWSKGKDYPGQVGGTVYVRQKHSHLPSLV